MSSDKTRKIAKEMSQQFERDLKLVADIKTNPRLAVIKEMSRFWPFENQSK